jgi:hypothetical protein
MKRKRIKLKWYSSKCGLNWRVSSYSNERIMICCILEGRATTTTTTTTMAAVADDQICRSVKSRLGNANDGMAEFARGHTLVTLERCNNGSSRSVYCKKRVTCAQANVDFVHDVRSTLLYRVKLLLLISVASSLLHRLCTSSFPLTKILTLTRSS